MSASFCPAKLCRARCVLGLTQKELAFATGVNVSSIQHWESGRHFPTGANVGKLARALRVDFEDLLEGQRPGAAVGDGSRSEGLTAQATTRGDNDGRY